MNEPKSVVETNKWARLLTENIDDYDDDDVLENKIKMGVDLSMLQES